MNMILTRQNKILHTSDLALAATLCCLGYPIETIDKSSPTRAVFHFKRDEKIDAVVQSFFSHQLKVDPLGYFNYIKELKSRIHSA